MRTIIRLILIITINMSVTDVIAQVIDSAINKEARNILNKYGNGSVLTKEKFIQYLHEKAFLTIDTNGNAMLELHEYESALLFCMKKGASDWNCDETFARQSYQELLKINPLDPYGLQKIVTQYPDKLPVWASIISPRVTAHLLNVCYQCTYITEKDINQYLDAIKRNKNLISNKDNRLVILLKDIGSLPDAIDEEQFNKLIYAEIFQRLDKDHSDTIDLLEYHKQFPNKDAVNNFNEISGHHLVISLNDFREGIYQNENIYEEFVDEASNLWLTIGAEGDQIPITLVLENLQTIIARDQQEAALKGQPKAKVFGKPWLPGNGVVLSKDGTSIEKNNVVLNSDVSPVTLRFIKDYLNHKDRAEAAQLNWTKTGNDKSVFGISAALRLDWHNDGMYAREGFEFQPNIGFQIDKSGSGSKRIDKRTYFIGGDFFKSFKDPIFFLHGAGFKIVPLFKDDIKNDVKKVVGLIEIEPVFQFTKSVISGVDINLNKRTNLTWFFRPIFAFEPNLVIDKPTEMDIDNGVYFRYGMQTGISIFKHLDLTYTFKQREDIGGFDEGRFYNELLMKVYFDQNKQYSFNVTHKEGEDGPTFDDIEQTFFGFGIKF